VAAGRHQFHCRSSFLIHIGNASSSLRELDAVALAINIMVFMGRDTMPEKKIRVLIAKPGLDGHDRGAKVVARALRDSGMEVIYSGLRQTPEQIVQTAVQEDVDAVGLSILSGAHMTLFGRIVKLLKETQADDILLFGGGIIPDDDIPKLTELGVDRIFQPNAKTSDIIDFLKKKFL